MLEMRCCLVWLLLYTEYLAWAISNEAGPVQKAHNGLGESGIIL